MLFVAVILAIYQTSEQSILPTSQLSCFTYSSVNDLAPIAAPKCRFTFVVLLL